MNTSKRITSRTGTAICTSLAFWAGVAAAAEDSDRAVDHVKTASPIKHVIIIVGENRSFDHVYATHVPKDGQRVRNLLSEGIVNADGSPGPSFTKGHQFQITWSSNVRP